MKKKFYDSGRDVYQSPDFSLVVTEHLAEIIKERMPDLLGNPVEAYVERDGSISIASGGESHDLLATRSVEKELSDSKEKREILSIISSYYGEALRRAKRDLAYRTGVRPEEVNGLGG